MTHFDLGPISFTKRNDASFFFSSSYKCFMVARHSPASPYLDRSMGRIVETGLHRWGKSI